MRAAVGSDFTYGLGLAAGLGVLIVTHNVTLVGGAFAMLIAALAALVPLGRTFFAEQLQALKKRAAGALSRHLRDLTRWSLLGRGDHRIDRQCSMPIWSTFIAGPGPFALLALGIVADAPCFADAERLARPGTAPDDPPDRRQRLARVAAHAAGIGFGLMAGAVGDPGAGCSLADLVSPAGAEARLMTCMT